MRLLRRSLRPVSLIKPDGRKFDDIMANLQSDSGKMLTQVMDIPFEEGDSIKRTLSNGITETYEIMQVNYATDFLNIDIRKITNKMNGNADIVKKDESTQDKIKHLINDAEIIVTEELHTPEEKGVIFPDYISGPRYDKWMSDILILAERELKEHPLHAELKGLAQKRNQMQSSVNKIVGILRSTLDDKEFWNNNEPQEGEKKAMGNKVFIVHGHDEEAKITVARTLEKAKLKPIILHEQANIGKTIIEKLEYYTDVDFAIVLYTECDLGRAKEEKAERYRARQNVVYEHGYLIGKLGREKVFALVKGDVETPGDISGVVYTPMDPAGAWKMDLVRDMQAVGISVNMNDLL